MSHPTRRQRSADRQNRQRTTHRQRRGAVVGTLGLAAVIAGTGAIAGPAHAAPTPVTIDPKTRYQTLEGWGTSLAWWGNVVGGWSATNRDAVADLLFADSGLDMNIVRYNLGAGTNPDPNKNMRVGAEIPSFSTGNGTWNWNADANQRAVLSAAQSRGVNIVEGFVNSPPVWMLQTACTPGAPGGGSNLPTSRNADFADYIAEVTAHFSSSWGTKFRTVSAFNEPISTWWQCSNNQEGNHVERSQQAAIIQAIDAEMTSRGLPTGVIGSEEYAVDQSLTSWNAYTGAAREAASQINTHTYSGHGSRAALRDVARTAGKRLWVSEVGIGGTASHNHNDLTSATQLAERITDDLTTLRPDAWVYWQAVENEAGNNNYGFIHANFTGSQSYWTTKQYHAMANFSRYIKPGSIVIGDSDDDSLATFDPATGKLVVVTHNTGSGSRELAFDVSGFGSVTGSASRYETSSANNASALASVPVSGNKLTVTVPGNSVTTLVLGGLSLPSIGTNLLANPGFEAGSSLSGWVGEVNPSLAGVETNFPQAGSRDGYLHPTSTQDVGIAQSFTATQSGTYTFTAHAATNVLDGVILGIDVAGSRRDSRPVVSDVGYRRYELTATVSAGQTIKVWMYSPKATGWVTLDSTSLARR